MASPARRVGDTFTPEDPVARFVTMLAMIGNDASRLGEWTRELRHGCSNDPTPDAAGKGLFLFRLQIGFFFEARRFLTNADQRSEAVRDFIATLPAEFHHCRRVVTGSADKTLEKWMKVSRNGTFHYPNLPPDVAMPATSEIGRWLTDAADATWESTLPSPILQARYSFADEVIVQSLPDLPDDALYGALGDMIIALIRLAQIAVESYVEPATAPKPDADGGSSVTGASAAEDGLDGAVCS